MAQMIRIGVAALVVLAAFNNVAQAESVPVVSKPQVDSVPVDAVPHPVSVRSVVFSVEAPFVDVVVDVPNVVSLAVLHG